MLLSLPVRSIEVHIMNAGWLITTRSTWVGLFLISFLFYYRW